MLHSNRSPGGRNVREENDKSKGCLLPSEDMLETVYTAMNKDMEEIVGSFKVFADPTAK